MRVSDFDYELPEGVIAQEAIEPRDAARLLDVRRMSDHRFADLADLLQPGDLVVVNRTRVRAARLHGRRVGTEGAVELLLVRRLDVERWQAMVRPARRMRPGVHIESGALRAEVLTEPVDGLVTVSLATTNGGSDIEETLAAIGEVPLPPYFHGTLADPERYQTMFADSVGSAAAPTAGLHFTPALVARLGERGITIADVDLDVGLDTFRPMSVDDVADHVIHRERYRVPQATADAHRRTRQAGGRVVAVGTTVVRTLETAADGDGIVAGEGESGLFITPGYRFGAVDAIVTNFHAPRTTLIALVAAAIGPGWRHAYGTAIERGYRFLSFGDAMLIDPVGVDVADRSTTGAAT